MTITTCSTPLIFCRFTLTWCLGFSCICNTQRYRQTIRAGQIQAQAKQLHNDNAIRNEMKLTPPKCYKVFYFPCSFAF